MKTETIQKQRLKKQLRERFEKYLTSEGLRLTAGRFKILDKCVDQKPFFNIQSLYADIKNECRISLASVYQTIELLCQCNILRKHYLRESEASYEIAGKTLLHLVCLVCGGISVQEMSDSEDAENARVRNFIASGAYRQFRPTFVSASVYGRCESCQDV